MRLLTLKRIFPLSGGFLLLFSLSIQASTFSFQNTSPVLNIDSLETWLKNNPKVTPDRLINLVKVERSYAWVNKYRSGRYLPELMKLDSLGYGNVFKALVYYVKSVHEYLRNQHSVAFKSIIRSYNLFDQLNDDIGIFYASCMLIQLRFDRSGEKILIGSNLEDVYLANVRSVIKENKNPHNLIHARRALYIYTTGSNSGRDRKYLEMEAKEMLRFVKNNHIISYAQYVTNMYVSLGYYFQGRYLDSYRSNREGLRSLSDEQVEERISSLYNLSLDCIQLNKFQESWEYGQEALKLLSTIDSKQFSIFEGIYSVLMYLSDKLGYEDKILGYADSSIHYIKLDILQKQSNTLLALEQIHEKNKNEQKIDELENERKKYIQFSLIVSFFLIVIVFLANYTYKTNQSLRKLVSLRDDFIRTIAHDLRRPMHAFVGLSDVFAKLLRKGDTESIHKIAQSIDTSGLAVRQTLDNLLYWALAQKESLVVQPVTFCMSAYVQSVSSLFTSVMALNKQELQILCDDHLEVFSDPNALSLILRNLLDNSTKHTPAHGIIRVEVHVKPVGTYLHIEDTGKGMDQTQVESIRSILANPNQMRPHQQTHGLGLILVGLFAEKAKIGIQLESSPGAGTKYTVGPLPTSR